MNKKHLWMSRLAISLGLLLAFDSSAQEYRANLREQCRSVISDIFISLWNDEKLYREQSALLSKKLQEMQAERRLLELRLANLYKKDKQKDLPDAGWNQEAAGLSYQLETFTAQIKDLEPLVAESSKLALERKQQLDSFDRRLRTLFVRKELPVKAGVQALELAFRLDYRQECSEYNQLCPLDQSSAKLLADLATELPKYAAIIGKSVDAHTCDRYSKMRRRSD